MQKAGFCYVIPTFIIFVEEYSDFTVFFVKTLIVLLLNYNSLVRVLWLSVEGNGVFGKKRKHLQFVKEMHSRNNRSLKISCPNASPFT